MVTVYSLVIVEWKVDNGPPRAVRFVKSTPFSASAPEGSSLTDTQTILRYIKEQDKADQARLSQLAQDGLLTLAPMAQVKVPIPQLPPGP